MSTRREPLLVSFSGIDGAGKSTQIERLHNRLIKAGASVLRLAFWDHVVFAPDLRAGVSHKVLGGEVGIGAPDKPVERKDKNVQKWYLTLARSPLYFFDVLSLRRVIARARRSNYDVIIFDRYIYDQLANVPDNWVGRRYLQFLLELAPRPDIAFLLDADPEIALKRKPEYPLDFLYRYRRGYHRISRLAAEMVVIPPSDVNGVEQAISREFDRHWPRPNLWRPSAGLSDTQISA